MLPRVCFHQLMATIAAIMAPRLGLCFSALHWVRVLGRRVGHAFVVAVLVVAIPLATHSLGLGITAAVFGRYARPVWCAVASL